MDKFDTDINGVYAQRNELAVAFAKAAFAAGWPAGRGVDETMPPEWGNVVYVQLPNGKQVSWHIAPTEASLLTDLPVFTDGWDGTCTAQYMGWSDWEPVTAEVQTGNWGPLV